MEEGIPVIVQQNIYKVAIQGRARCTLKEESLKVKGQYDCVFRYDNQEITATLPEHVAKYVEVGREFPLEVLVVLN